MVHADSKADVTKLFSFVDLHLYGFKRACLNLWSSMFKMLCRCRYSSCASFKLDYTMLLNVKSLKRIPPAITILLIVSLSD